MKKLKLFFACLLMAVLSIGQVWASVLPTEDFEKQSAGSTYNSQISYDADDSNAGMAWYVEHGTVSTNSKLSGDKSMQMRGYYQANSSTTAWNGALPYLESKTAVTGLQSISLKIAAAATFKIDFMYREDGSSTWTAMKTDEETPSDATNLSFTTSASTVTYNIPSSDPTKAYFVKIVANSSSTHGANPSKAGNIVIRVDDVVFTYAVPAPSFTITAESNNTSYGSVALVGTTITATPETGYRISTSEPYSVAPANSATVAQNNNAFTVTPSANTTVTINFEAIPTYKVSFSTGTGNPSQDPITETLGGQGITLPDGPEPTCSTDGWEFAGWAEAPVNSQTTTAPTFLSGIYHPTANCTLYAVYKKSDSGSVIDQNVKETFENQTAGTTYNQTQTYTAANSNAGIAWSMYYGTVSANDKITGSNSAQMRWYSSATSSLGYIKTTTPISGLQSIDFKARVSTTDVKMSVWYSTNGEDWTLKDENLTFSAASSGLPFSSTINGTIGTDYYIKIGVGDGGTAPSSGNYKLIIDEVQFNYQAGAITTYYLSAPSCDVPTCSTPTISPNSGNFYGESQEVTIECTTEGASIYYIINGDDPTNGTLYEEPFSVTETSTVKAIAIKSGMNNSPIAEKTYTKVVPLATMADVQAAATSTDESTITVSIANWVVTAVSGSQVWFTAPDNLNGILLYNSGHGFTTGKKLNGLVIDTKVKLYNLYPELTSLEASEVTVTTADAITPRTTTIAALTSGHPAEQGTIVKLENLTYTASSTSFSDGANTIQIDTKLYSPALVDGASYTITGVVEYLASNVIKIMPRSADDVEGGASLPEVTGLAALKAEATGVSYLLTLENAVVTLVDGSNAFIEDATAGALIYKSGHGFSAGDKLNGQYEVTTATYQGKFEITAIAATTGTKTTGAEIPVTTLTIAQLNANFAANESKRIKIVGVNVTDAVETGDATARTGEISDGANAIALYAGKSGVTAALNDNIDVIGYPTYYVTTTADQQQLAVWAQADIKVNEKDPAGIAFDPESATHTPGIDDWSAPTFSNPNNLDVDFGTNNDAVATVSNTGVVTLAGGYGTAIITAHTDGDATHSAGNATYTITVNDPSLAPQNVVILAVYDTKYYAMSTTNANNGFTAIAVEYDGTQVTVKNAGEKAAIQWAKQTSGDNTTFQNAAGKYMKSADGASMSLQDAVCNWVWDATGEYYKIDGTSRTFFFQNTSGGIFKNYATSNLKGNGYSDKAQVIAIATENIVITSKVSAELAYDPASDEITKGDDWSAPTLDNPHSVTITSYASDNEAVATVEGGVIALAGGIGTAHITAHFDGDGSYLEGDAVYTITVNAPAPVVTGTTYRKVTSTENLTNGDYLIVYETTSVAFNGALETLDDEGNSISVTINEGVIAGTTAIDAAVFTIDKTAGTLKSASGKYIGVSSNSNGLKQTENAETYTHTLSIDGEGNAVIAPAFEGSTMSLRYNTASNQLRFRYYKDNGQQAIQLYKRDAYTRTVTEGRYGTICLPRAGKMVGASIYEIAYFGQASNKVFFDEIVNGEMVAGMPYVFLPNENVTELKVVYTSTTEAEEAQSNNGLHGTLSAMTNILASDNIYLVYQNQILHSTIDGSTLAANRAYIKLGEIDPQEPALAPGRRRVSMGVQGEQVATAIDGLNATEVPVKVLIDGQLFIIRGEKMFDATGRLVK